MSTPLLGIFSLTAVNQRHSQKHSLKYIIVSDITNYLVTNHVNFCDPRLGSQR